MNHGRMLFFTPFPCRRQLAAKEAEAADAAAALADVDERSAAATAKYDRALQRLTEDRSALAAEAAERDAAQDELEAAAAEAAEAGAAAREEQQLLEQHVRHTLNLNLTQSTNTSTLALAWQWAGHDNKSCSLFVEGLQSGCWSGASQSCLRDQVNYLLLLCTDGGSAGGGVRVRGPGDSHDDKRPGPGGMCAARQYARLIYAYHIQAAEALAVAADFEGHAARMRSQVEAEQRLGGLLSRLAAAEQAAEAGLQVGVLFKGSPCCCWTATAATGVYASIERREPSQASKSADCAFQDVLE